MTDSWETERWKLLASHARLLLSLEQIATRSNEATTADIAMKAIARVHDDAKRLAAA